MLKPSYLATTAFKTSGTTDGITFSIYNGPNCLWIFATAVGSGLVKTLKPTLTFCKSFVPTYY